MGILPLDMVLPMAAHEGARSAPLTGIDCEGSGSRLMLEEEKEEGEELGEAVERCRVAMTAVAEAWRQWRACELQVVRAAEEVGATVEAYREAEERCGAALTDAELDVAEDILDEAEEQVDAAESDLEVAEDEADEARVRLCDAEKRAAWARAIRTVARLRASRQARGSIAPPEVALPVVEQGEFASSEMVTVGRAPFVSEKEPVMVPALPTLSAAAAPVWVLPACLGALPKQGGWRRRCRGGGGCLEGVDNGGHWRQFDPGGQSV